ncbi:MAG: hypothetical protein ACRDRG_08335 [Pseudonocardiaceae bacterium]
MRERILWLYPLVYVQPFLVPGDVLQRGLDLPTLAPGQAVSA